MSTRAIADGEVTTIWNDGSPIVREDRFHRVTTRPNTAVAPKDACPVCWFTYCRAMPRDFTRACAKCGDAARVAAAPVSTISDEAVEL